MSMIEWAKKEIDIACKKERSVGENGEEWDYGCACYESALKAFINLCEDGHSGFSIKMTQNILNRLIDGKPLTPIEDTDDVWNEITDFEDGKQYQCKRMSSLFKDVDGNDNVTYSDIDRAVCVDIHNDNTYYSGFVCKIIDKMFPITMPYIPYSKSIKVYCEDLLTDPKNGDFDSIGILYISKPDEMDMIDVYRYFKESDGHWEEIDKDEWTKRRELHEARLAVLSND